MIRPRVRSRNLSCGLHEITLELYLWHRDRSIKSCWTRSEMFKRCERRVLVCVFTYVLLYPLWVLQNSNWWLFWNKRRNCLVCKIYNFLIKIHWLSFWIERYFLDSLLILYIENWRRGPNNTSKHTAGCRKKFVFRKYDNRLHFLHIGYYNVAYLHICSAATHQMNKTRIKSRIYHQILTKIITSAILTFHLNLPTS